MDPSGSPSVARTFFWRKRKHFNCKKKEEEKYFMEMCESSRYKLDFKKFLYEFSTSNWGKSFVAFVAKKSAQYLVHDNFLKK